MQTIRLRVNESIYHNLMWFLKRFNQEEIEVIKENDEFLSIQRYLQAELESIKNGTAKFVTLEQLDQELEDIINEYED